MSQLSHFNRASRRSGGDRTTKIPVNRDDATLLMQEAMIRAEFGEAGVKRFWEALEEKARAEVDGGTAE